MTSKLCGCDNGFRIQHRQGDTVPGTLPSPYFRVTYASTLYVPCVCSMSVPTSISILPMPSLP
jgi:hypothetical protein